MIKRVGGTAAVVALAAVLLAPARAAAPLSDFADAWAKVDDYTCTIVSHDVLGTQTQDRRENYWFKKPNFAKIEIVEGPGKGSGAVWHGGDTVVGHLGGILAGFKQTVSLHDKRATSLRGDTIDSASFSSILSYYQNAKGGLSEGPAETVDGTPVDTVLLKTADPAASNGVTREALYLSKATHLPVRRVKFDGDKLVKQQDFTNVKLDPGLKASDF